MDGQLGDGRDNGSTSVATPVKDLPDGTAAIAAGSHHTCVIADGAVWCWGKYQNGQHEAVLEPNDEDDGEGYLWIGNALVPVRVEGLPRGARMIAAGSIHTCAAFDTSVWCWEYDSDDFDPKPARVKGLTQPVTALAAAGNHTCAVVGGSSVADSSVWCWGDNQHGELGNGDTTNSRVPVRVDGLPGNVTALAAAQSHTCAVVDGTVWCWGDNRFGELGDGTTTERHAPVQVQGLPQGVTSLGAAYDHTCAVAKGRVWCWGANNQGQLGDGSRVDRLEAAEVQGLSKGVKAVAAGAGYFGRWSCAVRSDDTVACWGCGEEGLLGGKVPETPLVPGAVPGLNEGVTALAATWWHACAVVNGAAKCWGSAWQGALGNGSDGGVSAEQEAEGEEVASEVELVPVQVQGLTEGVTAISCRDSYGCAAVNGSTQCWGSAPTTESLIPVPIPGLGQGVTAVSAGWVYACAVVDGAAVCWGANDGGQLGDGSTTDSEVPVQVQGLTTKVTQISAADRHTCAVVDGGAWCWGTSGEFAVLGDGDTTASSIPVQVEGLTQGVTAISAGAKRNCAIVSGAAMCWGADEPESADQEDLTENRVPVVVHGLQSGVSAISVGNGYTCAVVEGRAKCWGSNRYGQVGVPKGKGEEAYAPLAPVDVEGLPKGVTAVYATERYTCALVDGSVRCWGVTDFGSPPDDTIVSTVPIPVVLLPS